MIGLWLEDQRLRLRDDLPEPEPAPGEALVRLLRAGICATDIELIKGYAGFTGIPGHELVGIVEQGPAELLGKRVVSEINLACGECFECQSGMKVHCEQRRVIGIRGRNGGFAERIALPVSNLHVVPDDVSTDAATFAEPLAAALQVQEQVDVPRYQRVLVVGDGKLGQLVAQTLALTGCDLMVAGKHESKLALLRQRGISTCPGALEAGKSFDLVVECTGDPSGLTTALTALYPRGNLVLKSTYSQQVTCDLSAAVVNEITIIGSRCGPFAPALQLLADGQVEVESMIDQTYPLQQGIDAFAAAQSRGALKVLLSMKS
jgi:2-desacetyl-2-hydroxyethyl bacteriochlorophyllide A dehydrogenase